MEDADSEAEVALDENLAEEGDQIMEDVDDDGDFGDSDDDENSGNGEDGNGDHNSALGRYQEEEDTFDPDLDEPEVQEGADEPGGGQASSSPNDNNDAVTGSKATSESDEAEELMSEEERLQQLEDEGYEVDWVFRGEAPKWPSHMPSFPTNIPVKRLVGVKEYQGGPFGVLALSDRQLQQVIDLREESAVVVGNMSNGWEDEWDEDNESEADYITPKEGTTGFDQQFDLIDREYFAANKAGYNAPINSHVTTKDRETAFAEADLDRHVRYEEIQLRLKYSSWIKLRYASPTDRLALIRAFRKDRAFDNKISAQQLPQVLEFSDAFHPVYGLQRSYDYEYIPNMDEDYDEWADGLGWWERYCIIRDREVTPHQRQYRAEHPEDFTCTERDIAMESIDREMQEAAESSITTAQTEALEEINEHAQQQGLRLYADGEITLTDEQQAHVDACRALRQAGLPEDQDPDMLEEIGERLMQEGMHYVREEEMIQQSSNEHEMREKGMEGIS